MGLRTVTLIAAPLDELLPGIAVSWYQLPEAAHAWAEQQALNDNEMITAVEGDYRAELEEGYEVLVVQMPWPIKPLTVAEWEATYERRDGPAEFAAELLNPNLAPNAYREEGEMPDGRANSMWRGTDEALRNVGLRRHTPVSVRDLAEVISGRHVRTGARVLPGGDVVDLVFRAPDSLSMLWTQLEGLDRVEVEDAVVESAAIMLNHLVKYHRVVAGLRGARSFAAALVLHVVGTLKADVGPIPPILHVHCCLFGVLDADGTLVVPDEAILDAEDVQRECDAVGGAELADRLTKMGYQLRSSGGRGSQSFEIVGVPQGLLDCYDFRANAGCAGNGTYEAPQWEDEDG